MEQLARKLGLFDAILIVIGIVIGSGIFLLPNLIARNLPSGPAILAIWIVAGLLSLFGAFAYAELGAMMPATGGQYVFLREAFGPACAFLCGWVFLIAEIPGGIAFLSTGFSIYLAQFFPLSPAMRMLASLALIAALSAINYIGVSEGAWTQRIFTLLKIAGLLFIIALALLSAHPGAPAAEAPAAEFSYRRIGVAMTACLMAYNGWSHLSFVAGELTSPQRNVPRSLGLGMGLVIALYLGANIAYLHVMTVPEIGATERVGAAVAQRILGSAGGALLSAIVLISIVGAINGCILTGARIPFAQARDGLFFSRFGGIHPRFQTPAFAILVQALWVSVLIVTGSYETLAAYGILAAWLFYTLTVAAVWVLRRKKPHAPRPYRMWGYPFTLWAFLIVSAWFLADAFVNQFRVSLISLILTAAGIPLYVFWNRRSAARSRSLASVRGE
ncbi:MAG TPA: amino acid permease [Bryobacteraceae bacterium]|nr:amino acid permease [Bryobacteraceae bacterium]